MHKRQNETISKIFQCLTLNESNNCLSFETYSRLMRAIKPDISESLIDAYWITLGVNSKEDGISRIKLTLN